MTILIDPPAWPFRGRLFSHVASDTSIAELHSFARRVGLHPRSYDGDHYDVPAERYDEVVAAKAVPVTNRALLSAVQAAGLRFRKRRGERPVDSLVSAVEALAVPHRLELFLSPFEAPAATTLAAVVVVANPRGDVLLVPGAAAEQGYWPVWGRVQARESPRDTVLRSLVDAAVPVDASMLAPVAQLRLVCDEAPRQARLHRVSHVAVYGAQAGDSAHARPEGRAAVDAIWADDSRVRECCADAAWWPLLERYLDDNRASSTARLSRADASHG